MPIRMIHDDHGATHVLTPEEAAEHEKLGWKRDEPAAVEMTGTISLRKPGRPRKEVPQEVI